MSVRLKFETDLATSIKATRDLEAAYQKLGKTVINDTKEVNALEKAAKRLVDQNLSPQEKYNQKLEMMAKAVKANRMEMEQAAVTAGRMRQKMDEVGGNQMFSVGGMAKLALSYQIIDKAMQTISSAYTNIADREVEAGKNLMKSLPGQGEMQQLPADSWLKNQRRINAMQYQGIVGPEQVDQATKLAFAMESAGYTEKERDYIQELARTGFVRTEGAIGAAENFRKIKRAYGDKESLPDIGNKILKAATIAQADLPQTLDAILEITESGQGAGKDFITGKGGQTIDQVVSQFLAVESKTKDPRVSATKLRNFYGQMAKKGYWKAGGNLQDTLKTVDEQIKAKGGNVRKVLKEERGFEAWANLKDLMPFIADQEKKITQAPVQDLFAEQNALMENDPHLGPVARRQRMENRAAFIEQKMDSGVEAEYRRVLAERRGRFAEQGAFAKFINSVKEVVDIPNTRRNVIQDWYFAQAKKEANEAGDPSSVTERYNKSYGAWEQKEKERMELAHAELAELKRQTKILEERHTNRAPAPAGRPPTQ